MLTEKDFENKELTLNVQGTTPIKEWLLEYVGTKNNTIDVSLKMIIETLSEEFPEFLLAVAEENWINGYEQALVDVEAGRNLFKAKDD